jgi:hypothetical protein
MALTIEQVAARVQSLRYRNSERDARNLDVLAVRKGKIAEVYPDFFPDGVDANVVANFIDVVARDLSEVMAPLPAVNCSAANAVNDRARSFADKRTRIASNYFSHSDLSVQMYSGADWYITYGFVPFVIELDEDAKLPRIRLENPIGSYPEFDRYGRCIAFAKRYTLTLGELVSQFPEYDSILLGPLGYKQDLNGQIEMIRYYDNDQSVVYVPARDNLYTGLTIKSPILERPKAKTPQGSGDSEYNNISVAITSSKIEADSIYTSGVGDGRDFYTGELEGTILNVHEVFVTKNTNPYL